MESVIETLKFIQTNLVFKVFDLKEEQLSLRKKELAIDIVVNVKMPKILKIKKGESFHGCSINILALAGEIKVMKLESKYKLFMNSMEEVTNKNPKFDALIAQIKGMFQGRYAEDVELITRNTTIPIKLPLRATEL